MNHFNNDLAYSESCYNNLPMSCIYRHFFPDYLRDTQVTDMKLQKDGVDTIINRDGWDVWIDEKFRRNFWPDILIEMVSNDSTGTKGWACKSNYFADFLLYIFTGSSTNCNNLHAHLIPVATLQKAVKELGDKWAREYPTKHAFNTGYTTHSVPIPTETFYEAVPGCRFLNYKKFMNNEAVWRAL